MVLRKLRSLRKAPLTLLFQNTSRLLHDRVSNLSQVLPEAFTGRGSHRHLRFRVLRSASTSATILLIALNRIGEGSAAGVRRVGSGFSDACDSRASLLVTFTSSQSHLEFLSLRRLLRRKITPRTTTLNDEVFIIPSRTGALRPSSPLIKKRFSVIALSGSLDSCRVRQLIDLGGSICTGGRRAGFLW